MAPLYFALALGYRSVRWWKLCTRDQCGAINCLVINFAFLFFGFDLAAHVDSFATSYRILAAAVITKAGVALALVGCAAAGRISYSWCITWFSLVVLNNALLIGVPLLDAMCGGWTHDHNVQMAIMQIVVWFPLLLVAFEARQAWLELEMLISVVPPADGDHHDGERRRR
jgi:auxin efflux carrier family protein